MDCLVFAGGLGEHLALPLGLDRVWADQHDRVPGLERQVDQPPVAAFDPDRDVDWLAEPGQPPLGVGAV